MLKQIVDGFSYNTSLIYVPGRYYPMALSQLDVLRRAENYRPRWWVVPQEQDTPIDPFSTNDIQIAVAGDSYFWGYSFCVISATDPDGAPTEVAAGDILITATDSCTGIPLFQDFSSGSNNHSDNSARMQPIIPAQPRLILDPGLVDCSLTNKTENTITCQWLLEFAEPCKIVDERERERQWAMQRQ